MDSLEINYLIKRAGFNQTLIAEQLGVAPQTVNRVICKVTKSQRIQRHISKIIGVPANEVFGTNQTRRSA